MRSRPTRLLWPLLGLCAAGEVAGIGGGGVHGYRALEGTFLGGCLFSGRVAGRTPGRALAKEMRCSPRARLDEARPAIRARKDRAHGDGQPSVNEARNGWKTRELLLSKLASGLSQVIA